MSWNDRERREREYSQREFMNKQDKVRVSEEKKRQGRMRKEIELILEARRLGLSVEDLE